MSSTAADILACAQSCASHATGDEAHMRSAVSRAYYAALHDSLGWEATVPALKGYVAPETRGTHAKLCARLASPEPTNPEQVRRVSKQRGYALKAFHTLRTGADYLLEAIVTHEDALNALSEANRVMGMIVPPATDVQ